MYFTEIFVYLLVFCLLLFFTAEIIKHSQISSQLLHFIESSFDYSQESIEKKEIILCISITQKSLYVFSMTGLY